jgi:NADH:ubiquinone oxidoreductase subunit C
MSDATISATTLARKVINEHPDVSSAPIAENKIELQVPPEKIRAVVKMIDNLVPDALPESLFGVDLQEDRYQLIYIFWSHESKMLCQLRVALEGEKPEIESTCDIFPGFEWHERETHEMFGIGFRNHPDLRPLLLPDELKGKFPLRKSFQTDRSRLDESGLTVRRPATEGGDSK